jgi:hypothetical protein
MELFFENLKRKISQLENAAKSRETLFYISTAKQVQELISEIGQELGIESLRLLQTGEAQSEVAESVPNNPPFSLPVRASKEQRGTGTKTRDISVFWERGLHP